jgi:hypothetical protein
MARGLINRMLSWSSTRLLNMISGNFIIPSGSSSDAYSDIFPFDCWKIGLYKITI